MKRTRLAFLLAPIALSGCMAANPARPVLTCSGECTYYGPQAPDPRVEMARVLTGGLSSVVGIAVGGDVLKSLGSASGAVSTIERTTTNNTTNTDRSAVTDRDYSSVTSASVSNTSVSNTSVSDVSSSNTTVGP